MANGPITFDSNDEKSFLVKIIPMKDTGASESTGGALLVDNTLSHTPAVNVFSAQANQLSNAALVRITAASAEFNQPALEIVHEGEHGNGMHIRLKGPSPQIEFVETDQNVEPHPERGEFELQVQGDSFYINGRSATDTGFERIIQIRRLAQGGHFRHLGKKLGFYGADAVEKPKVSGSRSDGSALQSLLKALSDLGLIIDDSTL